MLRVVATNRTWRALLLAGVAALALSACASNRGQLGATDYSSLPAEQRQQTLAELTGRYKSNPRDRDTVILYAAALRAAGQEDQREEESRLHRGEMALPPAALNAPPAARPATRGRERAAARPRAAAAASR